jgi:5-bromo-4-chloroindolyl phosphate hydrolysis protein
MASAVIYEACPPLTGLSVLRRAYPIGMIFEAVTQSWKSRSIFKNAERLPRCFYKFEYFFFQYIEIYDIIG